MNAWPTHHLCALFTYVVRNCYLGESNKPKMSESALQQAKPIPAMLEAGSTVEFGYPVQYGIIKRIEEDPISNKEIAIIEMVRQGYVYICYCIIFISVHTYIETICYCTYM